MPPRSVRLAVLECDTPLPNTKAHYDGGYGGVFQALLTAGAKASSLPELSTWLTLTKHQIELDPENYPRLDDIDAILITGSRHDSFADTPWINTLVKYTAKALATKRIRVIGVCFGHQIVGRALGAKVGRNDGGWEAAVTDLKLSEKGKEIFKQDRLSLHQMHRDIVYNYPEGCEELGSTNVCRVQGMYMPKRLITVQGHPEFNQEIMTEIIATRHKTGIFDDEAYEKHMKKVALRHDGIVVSQAFLRFLTVE